MFVFHMILCGCFLPGCFFSRVCFTLCVFCLLLCLFCVCVCVFRECMLFVNYFVDFVFQTQDEEWEPNIIKQNIAEDPTWWTHDTPDIKERLPNPTS